MKRFFHPVLNEMMNFLVTGCWEIQKTIRQIHGALVSTEDDGLQAITSSGNSQNIVSCSIEGIDSFCVLVLICIWFTEYLLLAYLRDTGSYIKQPCSLSQYNCS